MAISRAAWIRGWAVLDEVCGGLSLSAQQRAQRERAYQAALEVLGLTDEQWGRAWRSCLATWRETYMPAPALFRDWGQGCQSDTLRAEAARVFDLIASECSTYHPEGSAWRRETVAQRMGDAAALAFDAAGGSASFSRLGDQVARGIALRAFQDAYSRRAASHPQERPALPSPRPQLALPAQREDHDTGPTLPPMDARQAIAALAAQREEQRDRPDYDERMEQLRRQAREIAS